MPAPIPATPSFPAPPMSQTRFGGFRRFSLLTLLLGLVVLLRCWNVGDVFVSGRIFFVDPDCYSRMTRVREVVEHPGVVLRHHEFENWPDGTQPHTTAPFDYLIAALSGGMHLFMESGKSSERAIDLAGVWISPLLGMAVAGFLWFWSGRMRLPYRGAALLLFAASPILVHGTSLGRPDHQSLVIFCMAVALGAECLLLGSELPAGASKRWGIVAGAAWGMGLWVSLYEPGILFVVTLAVALILRPRAVISRERWAGWGVFFGILLLAGVIDGWHSPVPEPIVVEYFPNWARALGELQRVPLLSSTFARWTLALFPLTPLLLAVTALRGKMGGGCGSRQCAWFWLALLGATFALTCWQARWGYFLALVFAMSLPFQLAAFPKRWMALAVFAVSLWPVARDWEDRLGLSEAGQRELAQRVERRRENLALYDIAQRLRSLAGPQVPGEGLRIATLAPWWYSPALTYWSGQPGVTGSSHQSLPGIVDSARFYLADDRGGWDAARKILARRRVGAVVVYQPERVLENAFSILGRSGPVPEEGVGARLYRQPNSPPEGVKLFAMNPVFRVFLHPEGVEALPSTR